MRKLIAVLTIALAMGCSSGRPLVLVEVSLGDPGIKLASVEITATPAGGSPVVHTFDWSAARSDVLSAGLFLPADVEGQVAVRAAGMDATGAVEATGMVAVEKGKPSDRATLVLRRVGGAPPPDGGAPAPDGAAPPPDAGPGPDALPDAPVSMDLASPPDLAPSDVATAEPPSLTKCQVYEHAGPCTITPTASGVGIRDLRFSPDGKYLVSGGDDGKAHLWRVTPEGLADENRSFDSGNNRSSVHIIFTADSSRMALSNGDGVITVYEFPKGTMISQLPAQPGGIIDLFLSGDGMRLVSIDAEYNVKVWHVPTSKEERRAVLPNYSAAAVWSSGSSLWMAATLHNVTEFAMLDLAADPVPITRVASGQPLYAVAFSPDGNRLALANEDGSMNLWDITNKQKPEPGPPLWPPSAALPVSAAFSPDGRFVAGGCSRGMFLTGEVKVAAVDPPSLRATTTTMSSVMSLAYAPDGRAVAAGSWRCGKITYCRD